MDGDRRLQVYRELVAEGFPHERASLKETVFGKQDVMYLVYVSIDYDPPGSGRFFDRERCFSYQRQALRHFLHLQEEMANFAHSYAVVMKPVFI